MADHPGEEYPDPCNGSEAIERALNPCRSATQDMGVDHGGPHVFVPQELLDGPDVVPVFEQMRGERVPERVARCALAQPGPHDGLANRPLED